ncbi:MAG: hypothetical protein FWG23_01205 [Eggerthellaceae bacterium]|jgi:hypothetical protein|nr:hypothetical protein [Eggerthellaceae bacterium]
MDDSADNAGSTEEEAPSPCGQVRDAEAQEGRPDKAGLYVAHFSSPLNAAPAKGSFEFESTARASSKQNRHDARIKMLELFGKDAVSWAIDDIKPKKSRQHACANQLELDFREHKPTRKRPVAKKYL